MDYSFLQIRAKRPTISFISASSRNALITLKEKGLRVMQDKKERGCYLKIEGSSCAERRKGEGAKCK